MLTQIHDHKIKELAEVHAKALILQSNTEVAKIQAETNLKQAMENKEKYNSVSTKNMFLHFEKREQYWQFAIDYINKQQ